MVSASRNTSDFLKFKYSEFINLTVKETKNSEKCKQHA